MSIIYIQNLNTNIILQIGLTFGSLYIFYTSLKLINKIYIENDNTLIKKPLIIYNSHIMIISGLTCIYSIKKLIG